VGRVRLLLLSDQDQVNTCERLQPKQCECMQTSDRVWTLQIKDSGFSDSL